MKRKNHRLLAYVVALIMVVSFMASPVFAATQRFKDVPTSRWYYDYVENLAKREIVGGFGTSGEFRPENKVERQHVAKMVAKAADLPYKGKRANFPDVAADNAMSPFIAALQERGIIKGYEDGTFRPTRTVTRAEVSVMISKAFGLELYGNASSMRDLKGHWAEGLVKILISNGIVKGYADGTFRPNNPVTRAELSKMLSVAMAVAGVQKAERSKTQKTAYEAQLLINSLPEDQDVPTRDALQERLLKAAIPDKQGGWFEGSQSDPKTGVRLTIHSSGIITNYDYYDDAQDLFPVYVIVENNGRSDHTFFRMDLYLTDSAGLATDYAYISPYSAMGDMKLPELPSYVDILPGGKVEGYIFFEIMGDNAPVSVRYKPHWDTLIEIYLD